MLYKYKNFYPKIAKNCFIAPSADIIGNVEIGEGSSIWFCAVIRGDQNSVKIGKNVSIQDNSVVHVDSDFGVEIVDDVVIGHNAIIHGTKIGTNCIIGMGAILLSGSKIGKNCIIGAGSLITEGTDIPDNSIVVGVPGKVVKQTNEEHVKRIKKNVENYVELNKEYLERGNFSKI